MKDFSLQDSAAFLPIKSRRRLSLDSLADQQVTENDSRPDRNLRTTAILPPSIGRTRVAQITSHRTWLSGTVSVGSRKLKLRRAAAELAHGI
jgi:hypothetical protein